MTLSGTSALTNDQFSHPLASPTSPPRETPSPDSDPTAAAGGYQGFAPFFLFANLPALSKKKNDDPDITIKRNTYRVFAI